MVRPIYNKNKTFKNNINLSIEPEFEFLNNNSFLKNQEKEKEMLFAFADTEKNAPKLRTWKFSAFIKPSEELTN